MAHIELMDCERALLAEIEDTRLKQADVALTYAMALVSSEHNAVNWAKVNQAIMDRWSLAGLKRVKEMAWKRVETR